MKLKNSAYERNYLVLSNDRYYYYIPPLRNKKEIKITVLVIKVLNPNSKTNIIY